MKKFGYAECVPGPGTSCQACHKGKKTCDTDDHLFAANPDVRRAFHDWKNYCTEQHANNDSHISVRGTYGTIEGKPTKGTHHRFNATFHRLRRAFEDVLAAAETEQIAASPFRTARARERIRDGTDDRAPATELDVFALAPATPSHRRSGAADARVTALAQAAANAFGQVGRRADHTDRRLDGIEDIMGGIAVSSSMSVSGPVT
jgi:hypothetical protein